MAESATVTLEKIVSLCKRRGFIYPSAEIYGGLNGVYDTGPLGTLIKQNIKAFWLKSVKAIDYDVLTMDGALVSPATVWQASGHLQNFHDPLVDCLSCGHRFRADDIDREKACSHCGNKKWTEVREFHLMFKTHVGAMVDASSVAYLRSETAQAIFVNFKNVMSSNRVKIPFGIAQIGKAFRNEITPKQFIFRMREFEQMEIEFFCKPEQAEQFFAFWLEQRTKFYVALGVRAESIRLRAHEQDELSHYSKGTSDVEYFFPFGWKELEGIAYRTDYDLKQHTRCSGKDLSVYDEETKSSYIPHVVECSVGVDRLLLALLANAYYEDIQDGEVRTVLRLHPAIAPIKVAFLPLTKTQAEATEKLYREYKKNGLEVQYDLSGSIGKRYRRQDEIGTPLCVTYDFETEQDQAVTVRHRDSMKQERIALTALAEYIRTHNAY